jgi:alpha-mannosidase
MKNRVHLICNAHLDPVWQWRWTEGCSEAIATFRNAVEIIHEYPELIFNHNEAILYQWIQKYDPRLFNEIKDLIAQNRWFIAGGWYLQPDVNLPPYENLLRHIRFGRKYFKTEFGVEPRVAYNFDSFGHPAGLPKLLRDFGYELYIHQRPEIEFLTLPGNLYHWNGLDNSSIPAYRIEIGLYHTERLNITQRLAEATKLSLELKRDVALFWGLGDHGGGATRIDLNQIRDFSSNEKRVEVIHSTTDRFYDAIKPLIPGLPVYEGSLQRVFTGCYTSLARVKRRAVETSAAAVQAERLATSPSFLRREQGEVDEGLADIWSDILFNDFHDILPGSCTQPAEQDALDLYGRAMENIRRLNMASITEINQYAKPLKALIPVTLFNSNPDLTNFPVEFECMSDYRPLWDGDWVLKLFDRQGNEIICQEEQPEACLPFHRWRRKISFLARDTGFGVHYYYIKPVEAPADNLPGKNATTPLPGIKEGSGRLPIRFLVLSDTADSWGTNTWSWRDIEGSFKPDYEEKIIENGLVRTIYESTLVFHHSYIIVHRISYAHWPISEYKIRIQWNEKQKRLKVAVPAGLANARLIAQIPGGAEEFPADGQEYVHGTWLTLLPPETRNPVTDNRQQEICNNLKHIAHSGLHGFDFDGNEVRFSVLRSAAYCHEQGYDLNNGKSHKYMDLGVHEIRMAIWDENEVPEDAGISGFSVADPSAIAEWLNASPLVWPHLPIG